ncbi:MAG: phytanoyl-CoA dioxygenase family protein, partial [Candidatus Poribacteria bacterium]|nr:phytanoyl-CoA dioxygenase family protein [Candidatus Poribacteria bacterium]
MPDTNSIEVPRPLDQDQIERYLEDGFLVVPEVLTPGEISELKREIIAIAKGKYSSDNL